MDQRPAQADRLLGFGTARRITAVPHPFIDPCKLAETRGQVRLLPELCLILAVGARRVVANQALLLEPRDQSQERQADRLGVLSTRERIGRLVEEVQGLRQRLPGRTSPGLRRGAAAKPLIHRTKGA